MFGWFHFREDRGDLALCVDDKGRALGAHVFLSIHGLLNPDTVGRDDGFFRIAEQGEGERKLGDEFLMGLHWIDADAEERRARGLNLPPGVSDAAGLGRAAWRVILGIEIEDDGFPLEIGK